MNIGTIVEFFESMVKSSPMTPNNGAYGGDLSGGAFNPIEFIKKPQVGLRFITCIFSVIVFACIASEELYQLGSCPLNGDAHTCGFGISVGVLSFLICILFLIIDARFDSISSIKIRKRAVILDFVLSVAMAIVWFLCFCYLCDSWRKTDDEIKKRAGVHEVNTAIAFSFFSIITWAMISLLNFLRYRQGIATIFNGEYEDQNMNQNADPNQDPMNRQAPFNSNSVNNFNSGYQQPTY